MSRGSGRSPDPSGNPCRLARGTGPITGALTYPTRHRPTSVTRTTVNLSLDLRGRREEGGGEGVGGVCLAPAAWDSAVSMTAI
jgi:hypothetical protein